MVRAMKRLAGRTNDVSPRHCDARVSGPVAGSRTVTVSRQAVTR